MHRNRFALLSFAAFLALLLGVFQTVIWNGDAAPAWARALVALVAPPLCAAPFDVGVAQQQQPPPTAYFVFGRCVWLVYAAMIVALAQRNVTGRARAISLLLAGGAALADVLVYGLSDRFGVPFRETVFWKMEAPLLLGLTLFLTGSALAVWRTRRQPPFAAMALPCALAATALLHYMPHGPLLGLAVALLFETYRDSTQPMALPVSHAVRP